MDELKTFENSDREAEIRLKSEEIAFKLAKENQDYADFLMSFENNGKENLNYKQRVRWDAYKQDVGKNDTIENQALFGMMLVAEDKFGNSDISRSLIPEKQNMVNDFLKDPKNPSKIKGVYPILKEAEYYNKKEVSVTQKAMGNVTYNPRISPTDAAWERKATQHQNNRRFS